MPEPATHASHPWVIRHDVRPGDLGRIVQFHGVLYAKEYGFDPTFEAYVAGPLSDFVRTRSERDRLWIAEVGDRLIGCIAIVGTTKTDAQLRWFLVDPSIRGQKLGRQLLNEAIAFAQECGYKVLFLWTVNLLAAAEKLYLEAGFEKVEERPGVCWGVDLVEEKYVLNLNK